MPNPYRGTALITAADTERDSADTDCVELTEGHSMGPGPEFAILGHRCCEFGRQTGATAGRLRSATVLHAHKEFDML